MVTFQIILMAVSATLCLASIVLLWSGRLDLRKQLELDEHRTRLTH